MMNPLTNILTMFRDVTINNNLPQLSSVVIAVIETVVMLLVGTYVFYKNQDEFILNI